VIGLVFFCVRHGGKNEKKKTVNLSILRKFPSDY
jgi:hypothetical protein